MTMDKKINVLVVEDSPVAQQLLVHILNSDPRLHVLGTANDGVEALQCLERNQPDVIVMDIHMSGMDGFETTRKIMETQPVPIVVCSASRRRSGAGALRIASSMQHRQNNCG